VVATFSKPFAVCPDCGANGKECGTCEKSGWITKDSYELNFQKAFGRTVNL
jgi:hypothetical protein